jgi:hypothetical protein
MESKEASASDLARQVEGMNEWRNGGYKGSAKSSLYRQQRNFTSFLIGKRIIWLKL